MWSSSSRGVPGTRRVPHSFPPLSVPLFADGWGRPLYYHSIKGGLQPSLPLSLCPYLGSASVLGWRLSANASPTTTASISLSVTTQGPGFAVIFHDFGLLFPYIFTLGYFGECPPLFETSFLWKGGLPPYNRRIERKICAPALSTYYARREIAREVKQLLAIGQPNKSDLPIPHCKSNSGPSG